MNESLTIIPKSSDVFYTALVFSLPTKYSFWFSSLKCDKSKVEQGHMKILKNTWRKKYQELSNVPKRGQAKKLYRKLLAMLWKRILASFFFTEDSFLLKQQAKIAEE